MIKNTSRNGVTFFACSNVGRIYGEVLADSDDEARAKLRYELSPWDYQKWTEDGQRVAVAIALADSQKGNPAQRGRKCGISV